MGHCGQFSAMGAESSVAYHVQSIHLAQAQLWATWIRSESVINCSGSDCIGVTHYFKLWLPISRSYASTSTSSSASASTSASLRVPLTTIDGSTVNQEIFVVELCTKIKLKCLRITNVKKHGKGSFVRKLFNSKIYRTNILTQKFCDLR